MSSRRPRLTRFSRFALPAVLALALLRSPVALAQGSGYPGCPSWNHAVTFVNNCSDTVTITATSGCFSQNLSPPPFNGSSCWPKLENGSFTVAPGAANAKTVQVMSCWSGNFGVACKTCKIPVQTLAEFTFDGGLDPTTFKHNPNLLDTYDVSLVDGFTRTFGVAPNTSSVPSGGGTCATAGCTTLPTCPAKLVDGDACLSPCQWIVANSKSGSDSEQQRKYCCKCSMKTAATCSGSTVPSDCQGQYGCSPFSPPGSTNLGSACCPWYKSSAGDCSATTADRAWEPWAQDYIAAIRKSCPGEYAWQYDDQHGIFTCQGKSQAMSYTITVCP